MQLTCIPAIYKESFWGYERVTAFIFMEEKKKDLFLRTPWMCLTNSLSRSKEMKGLKVGHVRMDCLRRSTFPLLPSLEEHNINITAHSSALTHQTPNNTLLLLLPRWNAPTLKERFLCGPSVTARSEHSLVWNVGRPRPAVNDNTRVCRADDLQRSQPW